ncbi:3-ketoacyl-CoA thiolase 5, peroxisomal [Coemansia thaxteri]|nr:3-ketoacyl-CoA thiolase 5, peroxisomal [Coemansia thaxteri]
MCLLSKLFLDQKTIYYDIGNFLFYILLVKSTDNGETRYSFVGYFSKEKTSVERNNLACILVLPPFRGQSYGQLLIELSYELTKLERTTGGPEQPLSSQGFHSYRLALLTGIRIEDVLFTLDDLGLLEFWLGRHIVCVADETLRKVIAEHRINLALRSDPNGMLLDKGQDCSAPDEAMDVCDSQSDDSSSNADTSSGSDSPEGSD